MSLKDRILETMDIREVISDVVNLRSVNHNHLGLCPFHEENTPSFYVYHDHFHCYGCHAHGDVITFVMKHYRLEFLEALRWLARKAGIDDSELNRRVYPATALKQKTQQALFQQAQQFLTHHLWDNTLKSAEHARQYILSRGYTAEFLKDHGFGYCPDGGMDLYKHLSHKGFSQKDLLTHSLVSQSSHPHSQVAVYDFFKGRLTLPIFDHQGQIIAFSGRVIPPLTRQPKYKNSRYAKNKVLYGFHWAKPAITQTKRVIITEGYMDTLRLRSVGFHETVSCQGTALSRSHLNSLAPYARQIILLFDGDEAGNQAAMRVLPQSFQYPQLNFYLCCLPHGHDPDSYLQDHSTADLEALITQSPPLLSAVIHRKIHSTTPSTLLSVVTKDLLPWIKSLQNPLQQELMIRQLAEHSGLSHRVLTQQMQNTKVHHQNPPNEPSMSHRMPPPLWSELIVHLYLSIPQDELDVENIKQILDQNVSLDHEWIDFMKACCDTLLQNQSPKDHIHVRHSTSEGFTQWLHQRHTQKCYATEHRRIAIQHILLEIKQQMMKQHIADLQISLKRENVSSHWSTIASAIKDLHSQSLELHKQSTILKKKLSQLSVLSSSSSSQFSWSTSSWLQSSESSLSDHSATLDFLTDKFNNK